MVVRVRPLSRIGAAQVARDTGKWLEYASAHIAMADSPTHDEKPDWKNHGIRVIGSEDRSR